MSRSWIKSGLANTFRIRLAEAEPIVVETSVADAVAWENANKGQSFQSNVSARSLMWTAWRALRVAGLTSDRFDAWVDKIVDFEMADPGEDEDGDGLDPTQPGQLDG